MMILLPFRDQRVSLSPFSSSMKPSVTGAPSVTALFYRKTNKSKRRKRVRFARQVQTHVYCAPPEKTLASHDHNENNNNEPQEQFRSSLFWYQPHEIAFFRSRLTRDAKMVAKYGKRHRQLVDAFGNVLNQCVASLDHEEECLLSDGSSTSTAMITPELQEFLDDPQFTGLERFISRQTYLSKPMQRYETSMLVLKHTTTSHWILQHHPDEPAFSSSQDVSALEAVLKSQEEASSTPQATRRSLAQISQASCLFARFLATGSLPK